MNKLYIAIFDEHKLTADFIHNNLERLHRYDVLFSAATEDELFKNLTDQVSLLLLHASHPYDGILRLVKSVLLEFKKIKVLIYSAEVEPLKMLHHRFSSQVKVISDLNGYPVFFEALRELLPDHKNHIDDKPRKKDDHDYLIDGFEKIRKNRKWILILKSIEDGMKPKEMNGVGGLKLNSINTYIENMMEETGCRNHTELVLQSKKRGII